ncbi:MAG: PAS domain S-box protein, partial [Candidatus Hydrothermarchaeales archaeon]
IKADLQRIEHMLRNQKVGRELKEKIIQKLKTVSIWHFVWMSVVLSEGFTSIMSVILRGRITYDYLLTGGVVSLIVASLVIYLVKQIREIDKRAEEALKESEARYRNIFNSSTDAMCITNFKGVILESNPAMSKMYGYSREDLIGIEGRRLVHPSKHKFFEEFIKKMAEETIDFHVESIDVHKNGQPINVDVKASGIDYKGEKCALVILRDISERKRAEEEMRRRLMRYRLEDGRLYLVKESLPSLSVEAFQDLLKVGLYGIVVSRSPMEQFEYDLEGDLDFWWLAEAGEEKGVLRTLEDVEKKISELPGKSALMFDRLDYLISKNGFDETLLFVERLRETAFLKDLVCILSIDPYSLSKKELRLLEKEASEVELLHVKISSELFDVMRLVYKKSNMGSRTSHSDISIGIGISRPTVRKRVMDLVSAGFVVEEKQGRTKFVDLTDLGKSLLLK